MNYNYVSGPTSCDKTGTLLREAGKRYLSGLKTLIVGPSIAGLNEYIERFSKLFPGIPVEIYHSEQQREDSSGSVKVDAERAIQDESKGSSRIVLICHATLLKLDPKIDLSDWHCYIDETLDVFDPIEINLRDSNAYITDHLELEKDEGKYSRLVPINDTALRSIVENRNKDEFHKILKPIAEKILNPNFDCYTVTNAYKRLRGKKGKEQKLYCISVLHPRVVSAFGSVTVFSARFQESLHYHLWKSDGVTWTEDLRMKSKLLFSKHEGYNKTSIYWGFDRNYSKSFRDKHPENYELFVQAALATIGQREYLRLENNDIKNESILSKADHGLTISGRSHGLNKYRHIDHAIIVPAMNYSPVAGLFLVNRYKFHREQQTISFACHYIYQAISRTSMRDGDLERERIWVVPSESHAEWLCKVFEGALSISLALDQPSAGNLGRPRSFSTDNDRKNQSKTIVKNKARQINDFIDRIAIDTIENVVFFSESDGDVYTLNNINNFVAHYRSSWFNNLYQTNGQVICKKEHSYINWLKKESKKSYAKKDDIPLVSPAFYNPLWVGKGKRGKVNIVFASGIMLDFDDTDLTPEELADILKDLQILTYSTYSNSAFNLRYRAYIPTTRPMMIPEYITIVDGIIRAIEDAGYHGKDGSRAKTNGSGSEGESDRFRVGGNGKRHGIDMSKRGPYSLFHLPCRSPSGHSFCTHHSGPGRAPLDVNQWLLSLPPIEEPEPRQVRSHYSFADEAHTLSDHQRKGVEDAMREWFSIGTLPGEGNDAIWVLYQRLRDLYLPEDLTEEQLRIAANSSNTPRDRHKQVDHLMKGLREYRARNAA